MGEISKLESQDEEIDSDVECVDNLDSNQQRKKDEKRRRKLLKKMHVPRLEITVKYMRKEKRKFKKILKKNKSDITAEDFPTFKPIDDYGDIDLSDLVPDFNSVFALLLDKTENMKLWQDFINLPQEDQDKMLNKTQKKLKTVRKVKHRNDQGSNMSLAKSRYNSIDANIRKIIQQNDYIPWELLESIEEDIISPFSKNFDGILVMIMDNSFVRLLIHGLCQYHELKSISDNYKGVRHTVVEYTGDNFTRFPVAFSSYLHEICNPS